MYIEKSHIVSRYVIISLKYGKSHFLAPTRALVSYRVENESYLSQIKGVLMCLRFFYFLLMDWIVIDPFIMQLWSQNKRKVDADFQAAGED